jgi:hypothetical protein
MTLQSARTQKPSMDILSVHCGDQVLFTQMGSGSRVSHDGIAIVDDDRWMRNSLEGLLKSVEFRTESFARQRTTWTPAITRVLAASFWT